MSILLGKLEVLLLTFWVIQLSTMYFPFIGAFKVFDLNLFHLHPTSFYCMDHLFQGAMEQPSERVSLFYCVPGHSFSTSELQSQYMQHSRTPHYWIRKTELTVDRSWLRWCKWNSEISLWVDLSGQIMGQKVLGLRTHYLKIWNIGILSILSRWNLRNSMCGKDSLTSTFSHETGHKTLTCEVPSPSLTKGAPLSPQAEGHQEDSEGRGPARFPPVCSP